MKPRVPYRECEQCIVGIGAVLLTESHYSLETRNKWRITSLVVRLVQASNEARPTIETENTIYVPHENVN